MSGTLRDDIESGRYDELLLDPARSMVDPMIEAEEAALARAVAGGDLDPSAMFDELREAIVGGPQIGGAPFATGDTSQSAALGAEDALWVEAGGGSPASTVFGHSPRATMVRYLYWMLGHNPLVKNIIGHYVNLTVGDGFGRVRWKTPAAAQNWKKIARRVQWSRMLRKIYRHTYLLGEWFTVLLPLAFEIARSETSLDVRRKLQTKSRETVRGLGPDQVDRVITSGDPEYDSGSPRDVENVLGYLRSDLETMLADGDVIHHTHEDIGNLTRGVSILFPVLRWLRMFDKFAENRHWLNFARSRVPLVRKVRGGAARVTAESARVKKLPPPGSLITESHGTEYAFPKFDLDASDARHDGRTLIEIIASGVQLPVYFIVSNPTDTNYAALMSQDSPVVAMFEGLQESVWIPDLERLVSELTGAGTEEFSIPRASVMRRNIKREADAWTPLVDRGIVSKQTVRERLGLDPEVEEDRLERERAEEDGFDLDPKPARSKGGRPERPDDPGDDGKGGRRPRPSDRS